MRNSSSPRNFRRGFTLIELLTVIAIMGILAALLLASLNMAAMRSRQTLCRTEEAKMVGAVAAYAGDNGRMPVSTSAVGAVAGTTNDFTFGTGLANSASQLSGLPAIPGLGNGIVTPNETTYQNNNSEVIAILRDDAFFPESIGGQAHIYNPKQHQYFTDKSASSPATAGAAPGPPDIGSDDVWRDPWGLPYMITVDTSGDNQVFDPYLNQIYAKQFPGSTLLIPGSAVVWSLGPMARQVDFTQGSKASVNKSIVTSQ